jgi:hypothetical protein
VLECRFYDDSNDGADASAKTGPRIAQAIAPTMHVKNEDYRRETGLLGAGRRRAAVVESIACRDQSTASTRPYGSSTRAKQLRLLIAA